MVNPILIGSVLGSTVAYLKKIGKIPYTLEEALEILMGHPIGDNVTWDNNEDNLGDEVTWNAAPQQTKVKFPRAKADKIVKKVEKHLKPYVVDMMACGSYRRGAQMIGDIDFVLILKPGYDLPEVLPANEGVNWVGNQKAQVIIDGEKVDFRVTTPDAWGATILYFTGPADFNIKYRWMAKKKGLKLSEYGLFDRNTGQYIAGKTENDIFTALGRPYKNPDVRKGFRAEYQPNQSLEDYSPQDLMTSSVVTGDFTTDSLKYGFGPTALSAEDNYEATYGKEQAKIRRRLKKKIMAQAIMGTKAGQWSARKSQELKRQYEAACDKKGLRAYKGNKTQKQQNLTDWSRQKWGTASGKKSSKTGEPYFPAKAIEALKDRGLYAKAKRQKQAATKAGKQHARYSDDIREVVKPFRSEEKFYYHGTDMRNLDTILSEGIKPTDVENTVWYEELEDISPHPYYYKEVDDFLPSVFVAETPEEAQWWSEEAGNTEIVVLKISPQIENLANFSDDGVGGWRTSEIIPNNYIVDILYSEILTFKAPLGRRSRRQSKILNEAEKIMGTKIWTTPELQEALFFQGIETDSRTLGYLLGIDGRFEMMGKTKTKSPNGRSYEVNTWRLVIKEADNVVFNPKNPSAGWYNKEQGVTLNLSNQGFRNDALEEKYTGLFDTIAHEYGHKVTVDDIKENNTIKRDYQKEFAAFMVETNGDFDRSKVLAVVHPACYHWIVSNLPSSDGMISDQTLDDYFSTLDLENNIDILATAKRIVQYPKIPEWHREWLRYFIRYAESGTCSQPKIKEAESFVTLDIKDMDRFLRNRRFKPVDLTYRNQPVKEWVYERSLPGRPNHVVRVYTSINRYGRQQGRGRDVGRDAIRVQVIYRDAKGETLVSSPTRVHRIGTWEKNLDQRLKMIAEEKPQVVFDSRGEPMTLRKYKGKLFWGSRDYPRYKETKSI